jgi:crotonobetainyl-CoA:carnitine CoA-transferase CaiB-like acyl-CoA transferase
MARHDADDIVSRAQELGVPVAKYRTPAEVVHGEHEQSRRLFAQVQWGGGDASVLMAPFQFRCSPLELQGGIPSLGQMEMTE